MAESMETEPFSLSATLAGHEQDVRAVTSAGDGMVLTASRDMTVRAWRRGDDSSGFSEPMKLEGHTHFVIAVCATASGAASGSNDKHVIEWDLTSGAPLRILEGHENTVSAVAYSGVSGQLFSASWDCSAKVWKDGQCVLTLPGKGKDGQGYEQGHQSTIWAILPVDDAEGHILTASGDRT